MFDSLSLSIVVTAEILAKLIGKTKLLITILVEILIKIFIEILTKVLTEILKVEASLVVHLSRGEVQSTSTSIIGLGM